MIFNTRKSFATLVGVTALMLAGPATAQEGACNLGQGSNAAAPPQHQISNFAMYTNGDKLGAQFTLAGDTSSSINGYYRARWTDNSGTEWWMAAQNADDTATWAFEYGRIEILATGSRNLVADGAASGTVSGSEVTIEAKLLQLGDPRSISVVGEADQLIGARVSGSGGGLFQSWDSTSEASYTIGDNCGEKDSVAERSASLKACSVFTDPSGDTSLPQHDLIGVAMGAAGTQMTVTWLFSDGALPSVDTHFGLHWLDDAGNGRFLSFYHLAPGSTLTYTGSRAESGSWDPAAQTYTSEATYLDADGWNKDVSDNALILSVPLGDIGNPTVMESLGSLVVSGESGIVFEDTANDGTFNTGSSVCGKAADLKSGEPAVTTANIAGAGSLGWLMLLGSLGFGVRRRTR